MNSLLCKSESRSDREGKFPSHPSKEWLYVGHYIDINGNYILKVGTTNDLKRRQYEHTRNYKRSPNYPMPSEGTFEYDFYIPLSKYNTLRYEDKTRALWIEQNIGEQTIMELYILITENIIRNIKHFKIHQQQEM